MSYNGIGLQTTRGSGTNGYVQTNKFHRSASRLQRTLQQASEGWGSGREDE